MVVSWNRAALAFRVGDDCGDMNGFADSVSIVSDVLVDAVVVVEIVDVCLRLSAGTACNGCPSVAGNLNDVRGSMVDRVW